MAAPSSAQAIWQGVLTQANQEEVAQRVGDLLRDRYYIMAIDTEGYSQIQLEQLLSMESLTSRPGEIEFRDRLGAHIIQVTDPDDPYPWHHTYLRLYEDHMHVRCYKRDRDRIVDWTIAVQKQLPA